jgi:hypothetical protein
MTREQAIKIVRAFGMQKAEAIMRHEQPQWRCDAIMDAGAEDYVDALMALGILKCDPPAPADSE